MSEEDEADPLVVLVVDHVVLAGINWDRHDPDVREVARVRHSRDREGRVDPAERVGELCRKSVEDAVDGLADELRHGDGHAARHEDDEGQLVVEPEDVAVDHLLAGLEVAGDEPQRRKHVAVDDFLFVGEMRVSCCTIGLGMMLGYFLAAFYTPVRLMNI